MRIFKISEENYKKIIKIVLESIKKGEVLIFPTDTVYGLLADAKNKKAVKKIFEIKKRRIEKPIPIFVKDLKMAKKIAKIDKKREVFLKRVWPGKVTVILEAKDKKFPKGVLSKGKIGLRIPNYKPLNFLLKKFEKPLAQTSANISGKPTSPTIKGILRQFKEKPDLIIDAGKLNQKPSIILDLTKFPPKILRQ